MDRIGLIAGNRRFPLIFSEAAKKRNYHIIAVAIKGETSLALKSLVDKIYWLSLGDFRRMLQIFKHEGVDRVVMAGQISPWRLFSKEIADNPDLQKLLNSIRDRKANTIFSVIAKELEAAGLELMDSTIFLEDQLPKKGTLTKKEPSFLEWEDVYFGLDLARKIANLDIGQAVAVKNKAIMAVEAFEGTDNLVKRSGKVAGKGVVIVKVSRPNQDMRFDIPVVGLNTVKNLMRIKAACLAIEAGRTLFIDKKAAVALADKKNISIVAV